MHVDLRHRGFYMHVGFHSKVAANPAPATTRFQNSLRSYLLGAVTIPQPLQAFFRQLAVNAKDRSCTVKETLVKDNGQEVELWCYPPSGRDSRDNNERFILMGFSIPQLPGRKLVFIFGADLTSRQIFQTEDSNPSQCLYPTRKTKHEAKAALTQFLATARPARTLATVGS